MLVVCQVADAAGSATQKVSPAQHELLSCCGLLLAALVQSKVALTGFWDILLGSTTYNMCAIIR